MYLITMNATKTNAQAIIEFLHDAPLTTFSDVCTAISNYSNSTVPCIGVVSHAINTGDNWGNAYAMSSNGTSIVINYVLDKYSAEIEITTEWATSLHCKEV